MIFRLSLASAAVGCVVFLLSHVVPGFERTEFGRYREKTVSRAMALAQSRSGDAVSVSTAPSEAVSEGVVRETRCGIGTLVELRGGTVEMVSNPLRFAWKDRETVVRLVPAWYPETMLLLMLVAAIWTMSAGVVALLAFLSALAPAVDRVLRRARKPRPAGERRRLKGSRTARAAVLVLPLASLLHVADVPDALAFRNEPQGFRKISWGTSFSFLPDTYKVIDKRTSLGGKFELEKVAVNSQEEFRIGNLKSRVITYHFYKDKFVGGMAALVGEDGLELLKRLRDRYGDETKTPTEDDIKKGKMVVFEWKGETTTINLISTPDGKAWTYWVYSTEAEKRRTKDHLKAQEEMQEKEKEKKEKEKGK